MLCVCLRAQVSLSHSLALSGDTKAIPPHPAVIEAVHRVLDSGGECGYGHSCGLPPTRQAVAELFSPFTTEKKGLTADVIYTHCNI